MGTAAVPGKAAVDSAVTTAVPIKDRPQQELVQELLQGIRKPQLVEARVAAPAKRFEQPPGRAWIYFKIETQQHPYVRGYWQARLISGHLRDLSRERGLPRLAGQTFVKVWPDGREELTHSTMIFPDEATTLERTTAAELSRIVRAALATASPPLKLLRLEIHRPLDHFAPEVVVRAARPRDFLGGFPVNAGRIIARITDVSGTRMRAEGTYLEVRDGRGQLVAASGYAARSGGSATTVGPAYAR